MAGSRMRQGRSATRGRLGRFGEERSEGMEDANGKGKEVENGSEGILEVESPPPREMPVKTDSSSGTGTACRPKGAVMLRRTVKQHSLPLSSK